LGWYLYFISHDINPFLERETESEEHSLLYTSLDFDSPLEYGLSVYTPFDLGVTSHCFGLVAPADCNFIRPDVEYDKYESLHTLSLERLRIV